MRRSAGFMTRSGPKKCAKELVPLANDPHINRVRHDRRNHGANRAKNRTVREH